MTKIQHAYCITALLLLAGILVTLRDIRAGVWDTSSKVYQTERNTDKQLEYLIDIIFIILGDKDACSHKYKLF